MIRRPPRSTLFPYHDALPIYHRAELLRGLPGGRHGGADAGVVDEDVDLPELGHGGVQDRKSTRLNSSHANTSYAVFCLKKKNTFIPFNLLVFMFLFLSPLCSS